jgi:glucokinase
MTAIITLDIGGTNIRCALFNINQQEPIHIDKINTVAKDQTPVERIIQVIKKNKPGDQPLLGIAAAVPGSVDIVHNKIILAPNVSGWRNINLGDILFEKFKTRILVNNDARLAAIGEWKCGAGQGHNDILYFTISTGVGGSVITGGQVVQGALGIATELGHIVLDDKGPLCGCGQKGHLEAFSSGTGIENYVARKIKEGCATSIQSARPSTKEIAQAVQSGDALAREAFEKAAYYLGIGVSNYLHVFNPSCVIFGGGVTQSWDLIEPFFMDSLEKHVLNKDYIQNLKFAMAELGDNAGLIGAFEYMKQNLGSSR